LLNVYIYPKKVNSETQLTLEHSLFYFIFGQALEHSLYHGINMTFMNSPLSNFFCLLHAKPVPFLPMDFHFQAALRALHYFKHQPHKDPTFSSTVLTSYHDSN